MYPGTPNVIDPAEVRPRRVWFVVAALAIFLGVALGAGMLVFGVITGAGSRDKRFGDGETVTVSLKPDAAIWVPEGSYGGADCRVTSAAGQAVSVTRPGYRFTTSSNGESWQVAGLVHVPAAGEYRVTCTGGEGRYAVGQAPRPSRLVIGILSSIGLFMVGIFGGVATIIVVAVRRNRYRMRFVARPMGPPAP
ncbi:hypothetical protein GCM10023196_097320 [Actinoallomurus vinaceus]|uniref:Serine/threonine protein kinase n=1 Tax=Actinoallomurus vinaceus TaxID=1080074 RepID=A0ABP8UUB8_9ACTN